MSNKRRTVIISFLFMLGLGLSGIFVIMGSSNNQIKIIEVPENKVIENKEEEIMDGEKVMHISLDDFIDPFEDITKNNYESIFENKTFNLLKSLHEEYGAVVSAYAFYENNDSTFDLSHTTNKYADEFAENVDWLKFGFHSFNNQTNYETASYEESKNDYEQVINELVRITGTERSIDRIPRLHNYAGNEDSLRGMKEAKLGIVGVLGADDKRLGYGLNKEQTSYLFLYDYYTDAYLDYFRTDIRLEHVEDLNETLNEISSSENDEMLVIFTHEPMLKNNENLVKKIISVSKFGKEQGYVFDFPSNRINK